MKGLIVKISFFFMVSHHNRLHTIDILKTKGLKIPNRFSLCYREEEYANHIFIECVYAKEIWKGLQKWMIIIISLPSSILDLLKQGILNYQNSKQ